MTFSYWGSPLQADLLENQVTFVAQQSTASYHQESSSLQNMVCPLCGLHGGQCTDASEPHGPHRNSEERWVEADEHRSGSPAAQTTTILGEERTASRLPLCTGWWNSGHEVKEREGEREEESHGEE